MQRFVNFFMFFFSFSKEEHLFGLYHLWHRSLPESPFFRCVQIISQAVPKKQKTQQVYNIKPAALIICIHLLEMTLDQSDQYGFGSLYLYSKYILLVCPGIHRRPPLVFCAAILSHIVPFVTENIKFFACIFRHYSSDFPSSLTNSLQFRCRILKQDRKD